MNIIHFVSKKDLDILFRVFAHPVEHHGEIDWIAPRWWYVMDLFRIIGGKE